MVLAHECQVKEESHQVVGPRKSSAKIDSQSEVSWPIRCHSMFTCLTVIQVESKCELGCSHPRCLRINSAVMIDSTWCLPETIGCLMIYSWSPQKAPQPRSHTFGQPFCGLQDAVLTPCGHRALCLNCGNILKDRRGMDSAASKNVFFFPVDRVGESMGVIIL